MICTIHKYEFICINIYDSKQRFVFNLLPWLIKNPLSPLCFWKIVTSIYKLSHKIELHLNRVGRGLQRFPSAFSPFFDELKYNPGQSN